MGESMLQRNSDFFFSRPMIYFGPFHHINEDDDVDEECEMMQPFILEIDPKHPLRQDIGLYFLWPDS